jgi:hypothetical protein
LILVPLRRLIHVNFVFLANVLFVNSAGCARCCAEGVVIQDAINSARLANRFCWVGKLLLLGWQIASPHPGYDHAIEHVRALHALGGGVRLIALISSI